MDIGCSDNNCIQSDMEIGSNGLDMDCSQSNASKKRKSSDSECSRYNKVSIIVPNPQFRVGNSTKATHQERSKKASIIFRVWKIILELEIRQDLHSKWSQERKIIHSK